jgi:hypothetical protein
MHDAKIEEMVQVNLSEYKADGGRVGLRGGGPHSGTKASGGEETYTPFESMEDYIKHRKIIEQLNRDNKNKQDYEEDKHRHKVMQQKQWVADGGRVGLAFGDTAQAAGIMGNLPVRQNKAGINELDLRETGGFIPPVGVKEKADDVPAMLSNNEFVWTADAVRAAGGGSVNKGAQILHDQMKQLESRVV